MQAQLPPGFNPALEAGEASTSDPIPAVPGPSSSTQVCECAIVRQQMLRVGSGCRRHACCQDARAACHCLGPACMHVCDKHIHALHSL